MKKIFTLAIALLTFAGNAMALDYEPEQGFTWQAFVGMNATKVTNLGYGGKIGGVFGLKLDYMLPKAHGTYLSAGVDWTMKGAKTDAKAVSASNTTYDGTDKFRLNYLEIPIRMGYRYNFSRELGVFGEFGPYFEMGITGKHKFTADADGSDARSSEWSYNAFKKSTINPNFQRWDAGLGFRVGAEYNQHYSLMVGCDWGITDMWRDKYRDALFDTYAVDLDKIHNFNFTIAFGYRF